MPANLPGLFFSPARDAAMGRPKPDGFELLSSEGVALEVTLKETSPYENSYVVVPSVPLEAAKTYRLRYPQGCAGVPASTPTIIEQTFRTGPAETAPTVIGSAAMTGHRVEKLRVWTVSGSCTTEITAALAHITVRPSPELKAYLPVARVGAFVNGQSAPAVNYEVASDGSSVEFDVYAGCSVADKGANRGLAPGKYKLELGAHVIGEAVDPLPIWTDLQLDCDGKVGGSSLTPTSPAGPGVSTTEPGHGGGCTMTRAPRVGGLWPLAAVAGVWALRRPRRRS